MDITERIELMIGEEKQPKLNPKDYLYKSEKGEKGYFVVTKRDTSGMRGSQDKFSMYVVDDKGNVQKDWGSHPSLEGAKKFGKTRNYITEATGEWSVFPMSRPLNKPIEVLLGGRIVKGKGVDTKDSGGGILVGGKVLDSNSKIKWRYL